jgi:hypothetical protein
MRFALKIWKCIVLQPHLLSEDREQNLDVSKELANRTNADENFLKKIITGDELGFTPMMSKHKSSRRHRSQNRHPYKKKHGKFSPM